MDEGVKDMTEETRQRLPGIIERIDELRDEVEKIHSAEMEELHAKREAMDHTAQIIAAIKAEQLYGAYVSLSNAAQTLANF